MKSLNDNPLISKAPDIFSERILRWLASEGFESRKNDSYCDKLTDHPYEETCFHKFASEGSSLSIGIYIFSYAIGVDIDYSCGGNLNTNIWLFKNFTFEEAYDAMVDFVNGYKN